MRRNDLITDGKGTFRILSADNNRFLLIDCARKCMPHWVYQDEVASFAICDPHDSPLPMLIAKPYEALDEESRKEAHGRFTMIAPILPVIGNRHERGTAITQAATEYAVSEQTIRNYIGKKV